jgi:acyl carrier protein
MRELIAELCAAVLGLDEIDPDESFFSLGGNSLLAVRLTNSIAAATGVRVSGRAFYEGSSVTDLARTVTDLRVGAGLATREQ